MPSRPDRQVSAPRLLIGSVAMLLAAGFGLTLWIFYPGVMTYDAKFVYEDIAKGTMGDWQSPVMVWLWGLIDPIAPGAGSMFLLIATTYWLGFGSFRLRSHPAASRSALLLPLLALTPPALAFAGIIWRDVLFATCWLLAASVAFAVSERPSPIRSAGQVLALVLVAMGVLLRPNALLAAPILAAYVIWPTAILPAQDGHPVRPGGDWLLCHRAARLLRRAGRETAASAADDHDLRSRRHQPFREGKPVSGRLERVRERDAAERLLPADPMGHLLAARALRFRDGQDRARKRLCSVRPRYRRPGCLRSCVIRLPICSIARPSCGIFSPPTI